MTPQPQLAYAATSSAGLPLRCLCALLAGFTGRKLPIVNVCTLAEESPVIEANANAALPGYQCSMAREEVKKAWLFPIESISKNYNISIEAKW